MVDSENVQLSVNANTFAGILFFFLSLSLLGLVSILRTVRHEWNIYVCVRWTKAFSKKKTVFPRSIFISHTNSKKMQKPNFVFVAKKLCKNYREKMNAKNSEMQRATYGMKNYILSKVQKGIKTIFFHSVTQTWIITASIQVFSNIEIVENIEYFSLRENFFTPFVWQSILQFIENICYEFKCLAHYTSSGSFLKIISFHMFFISMFLFLVFLLYFWIVFSFWFVYQLVIIFAEEIPLYFRIVGSHVKYNPMLFKSIERE